MSGVHSRQSKPRSDSRYVIVPVANLVDRSQCLRKLLVVLAELAGHLLRTNSFAIVVLQPLVLRDVADRTDGRASHLTRTLSDRIGHCEYLCSLLVEQQVIIAKVLSADVSVKVLGLHVKCEHVGEQPPQVARNLLDRIPAQIGRRFFGISFCRHLILLIGC